MSSANTPMKAEKFPREGITFKRVLSNINRNNTIYIFLLLVIFSSIMTDNFFTEGNLTNLLRQNASLGIVSFGMLMVILTGGIDLSVGAGLTLGNIIFAYTLKTGQPFIVALLYAVFAGFLCGLISGYMVAYQKLAPFVVTLAVLSIAKGASYIICNGASIQIKDKGFIEFSRTYFIGLPSQFYVMLAIFVIMFLVLRFTTYGRLVMAIGSNEEAVRLSGVRVNRYKMSVYCISGVFSTIAGIIVSGRTGVGSPLVGDGTEMDAIAAAVIGGASLNGGRGSVVKTIFGVFTLGLISNIMNLMKVPAYPQQVIKGIIILAAVLLQKFSNAKSKSTT